MCVCIYIIYIKSVPGTNSLILEYIQFQYQLHKIQQHGRNQYVWKRDKCPHCIIKNLVTIPVPFLQWFRLRSLRFSDSWLLTGLQSPVTSLTIWSFFLSSFFPACDFNSFRSLLRNLTGMYYVFFRNHPGFLDLLLLYLLFRLPLWEER